VFLFSFNASEKDAGDDEVFSLIKIVRKIFLKIKFKTSIIFKEIFKKNQFNSKKIQDHREKL
jgi:hypothetical protein